jgi:inhibitor of cysteine peptidase
MIQTRRSIVFAGLTLSLVLFSACGGRGEMKISAEDNGGQVTLEVGQTLVLSLKSNPTTGYEWEIAEIDEAILKETHHEYKADWPVLIGSGGRDVWRFRAEAEGRTTLTLNYRPSYKEAEPIQTFSVEVVVR